PSSRSAVVSNLQATPGTARMDRELLKSLQAEQSHPVPDSLSKPVSHVIIGPMPDGAGADHVPQIRIAGPSRLGFPGWLTLAAVGILGIALASRGLTDEGAVSLDGDMPHYLMNGVFTHDLLQDLPLRAPLQYAQLYYARYP